MSKDMRKYYAENPYDISIGVNGVKFVEIESVRDIDTPNTAKGNSKVGNKKVVIFNLPIEYTCRKDCECYKGFDDPITGKHIIPCYACHGCFCFSNNQAIYAENYRMIKNILSRKDGIEQLVKLLSCSIKKATKFFRWFECGDVPALYNQEFIEVMVRLAKMFKKVKFWAYTKKYWMFNRYVKEHGIDSIPENLVIIFSHWRNHDNTFLEMPNPYSFPVSEFIPLGCEEETKNVTHVCPCSDPNVFEQCINCSHPCYELKKGESMALLEHSTERTAERDKAVKEAHKRIAEKTA